MVSSPLVCSPEVCQGVLLVLWELSQLTRGIDGVFLPPSPFKDPLPWGCLLGSCSLHHVLDHEFGLISGVIIPVGVLWSFH